MDGLAAYTLASNSLMLGEVRAQPGTGSAAVSSGSMNAIWATTTRRAAPASRYRRPRTATTATIQAGR